MAICIVFKPRNILLFQLPHISPFWVRPPAELRIIPQYLLTRAVAVGLQTFEDAGRTTLIISSSVFIYQCLIKYLPSMRT